MSKQFINEVSRMKDLFGYKRGVVISEQIPYANAADANTNTFNPAVQYAVKGSKKEEYPECVQVFGNPTSSQSGEEFSINGTGDWADYFFFPNGFYGSRKITGTKPPHGKYVCDGATIRIEPLDGEKTVTPDTQTKKKVQTKPATTSKDVYLTPPELKQNVGNKTGVQAFQDWLDENYSGWHSKYQTLGGSVPKGYGKFGPITTSAWTTHKKEYLEKNPNLSADVKTLPLTPQSAAQPAQSAAQPGQAAEQPAAPPLANATTPIKTSNLETPESVYNSFYDKGLIQGDPSEGGDNRIRYKGPELDAKQQELLTKAMVDKGFKFLRKGNDNRLVYQRK